MVRRNSVVLRASTLIIRPALSITCYVALREDHAVPWIASIPRGPPTPLSIIRGLWCLDSRTLLYSYEPYENYRAFMVGVVITKVLWLISLGHLGIQLQARILRCRMLIVSWAFRGTGGLFWGLLQGLD